MIPQIVVFCVGQDGLGAPTHERTVVAHIGIELTMGVVLMPTAQQRGLSSAAGPRPIQNYLQCRFATCCERSGLVGKRPHKKVQFIVREAVGRGQSEMSLQEFRVRQQMRYDPKQN